jgi:integrase
MIVLGFNPDAVVHCALQPLSAPKVLFRRLYAYMIEQKLDLLELSAPTLQSRAHVRRTCARLCHAAGGELEQIQFLLGHVSVQTTERYLGCNQRIRSAVNDCIGIEPRT